MGGAVRIHTPLGPIYWSPIWVRSLLSLGKVSLAFVAKYPETCSSYTQVGA